MRVINLHEYRYAIAYAEKKSVDMIPFSCGTNSDGEHDRKCLCLGSSCVECMELIEGCKCDIDHGVSDDMRALYRDR
jgi:hypothetical protein